MSATAPPATTEATTPPRRLTRARTFPVVASVIVLFMAAASVPTPLYVVYQQAWGFSPTTLTVVFAVYVIGLLLSLLVVGGLSDHVGRRPVLAAAIALEAAAFVLFLVAGGVPVLLVARVLQGLATGAALTSLSAALVDTAPPHEPTRAGLVSSVAPVAGLGLGALGAGALVQYAPAPTQLVFVVLLVLLLVAAVAVALMPETSARVPGALGSLRPVVGVPRRLRADVLALVPILLASWSLSGLFLSLGPSVAAEVLGLHNHLVGGVVVVLLLAPGGLTSLLLRAWPLERLLTLAGVLLTAGTAVALVGVDLGLGLVGALGTVVAGVGFGAAALGPSGPTPASPHPTSAAPSSPSPTPSPTWASASRPSPRGSPRPRSACRSRPPATGSWSSRSGCCRWSRNASPRPAAAPPPASCPPPESPRRAQPHRCVRGPGQH